MLSGNNSILQKATDAKTLTGIGQEKETIALAYNSALAKKVGNGNSSAVTDSELNDELDSNEATASGNPIIVTFIKSGNAYEIDDKGVIKPSAPKDPSPSSLTATELAAIEANNTANPTDQIAEVATADVENTDLVDTSKIKAVLKGEEEGSHEIPIPVGATYVEGTENTGVVIRYKESEFVWVPVPIAISDAEENGATNKAMAINAGKDANMENNSDIMQSSMIYGSQHDAMINWMLKGSETTKTKVFATNNGNHNKTGAVGCGTYNSGSDVINNIYDLEENVLEWTQEACYNGTRVYRTGCYGDSSGCPAWRNFSSPDSNSEYNGSRLSLYIK